MKRRFLRATILFSASYALYACGDSNATIPVAGDDGGIDGSTSTDASSAETAADVAASDGANDSMAPDLQLCAPCTNASECGTTMANLCVASTTGGSFCAEDCTNASCSTGYVCSDVVANGMNHRQCLPTNGSCDCNVMLAGAHKACSITTPFGTCAVQLTCGGAVGWGACTAPSTTDVPDGTYTDDNCDGIDGTVTDGIFVSVAGVDGSTCGLTYTTPCAHVSYGVQRAHDSARHNVYVQAGSYTEVVILLDGISVWGGYDASWQRADRATSGHTVTITGAFDSAENEYLTIRAHGLTMPSTVADLVVVGPAASGAVGGNACSSYAVHAASAVGLTLTRVTVQAGNGAIGPTGSAGADAPLIAATAGMSGTTGGPANEFSASCDDSSRGAAGGAGTNSCSGVGGTAGGAGGVGGTMDTNCASLPIDSNARAGTNGGNGGQFTSNGPGAGGSGGSGVGTCGPTTDGHAAASLNGTAGSSGSGGAVAGGYWFAVGGGGGGIGNNGGGGGGGGGSGGCDIGVDSYGAGGGGGGAGGCAALGGGGSGGGGGGSFGVFAASSTLSLTTCTIKRGSAGAGGAGGTGGIGQAGGPGLSGGAASGDSVQGGAGGAGAHGGHGGGGGGGAGGISWGIYSFNSTVTQTCTFAGGSVGAGGSGGVSAGHAGNDGNAGVAGGTTGDVCTAPGGGC